MASVRVSIHASAPLVRLFVILIVLCSRPAAAAEAGSIAHKAFMKAVLPGIDDELGRSVAISGDRAIVGASYEDSAVGGVLMNPLAKELAVTNNSASNSGSAYIFERDVVSGNWTNTAFLKAPLAGAGDNFGHSVAISGDRAIVGAYHEASAVGGVLMNPLAADFAIVNDSAVESGAAYIFERNVLSGNWKNTAFLKAPVAGEDDRFGGSVAISGDRAIVGAHREDSVSGGVLMNPLATDFAITNNGAFTSGSAYIFERDAISGNWTNLAFLKAPLAGAGDNFGYSVAISGDRSIVGAYHEDSAVGGVLMHPLAVDPAITDNDAVSSGAAYIFERDNVTGNWTNIAFLKAPLADAFDIFGCTVVISGDRAIVGAYQEASAVGGVLMHPLAVDPAITSDGAVNSGSAYIFERDAVSGNWTNTAFLKAPLAGAGDNFGYSVAISGDRAIVGAYYEASVVGGILMNPLAADPAITNNDAVASGAAYIFERDNLTGNWANTAFLKAPLTGAGDHFGYSVAVAGDRAFVGAYHENSAIGGVLMNPLAADPALTDFGASASGAAYVLVFGDATTTASTGTTAMPTGVTGTTDTTGKISTATAATFPLLTSAGSSASAQSTSPSSTQSSDVSPSRLAFTATTGIIVQIASTDDTGSSSNAGIIVGITAAVAFVVVSSVVVVMVLIRQQMKQGSPAGTLFEGVGHDCNDGSSFPMAASIGSEKKDKGGDRTDIDKKRTGNGEDPGNPKHHYNTTSLRQDDAACIYNTVPQKSGSGSESGTSPIYNTVPQNGHSSKVGVDIPIYHTVPSKNDCLIEDESYCSSEDAPSSVYNTVPQKYDCSREY